MGRYDVSFQAATKHDEGARALSVHSRAVPTNARCSNSETKRGALVSRTLNSPCTTSVVPPMTATAESTNWRGVSVAAAWLAAMKNIAPEAAPRNCTTTTAKTGPVPSINQ